MNTFYSVIALLIILIIILVFYLQSTKKNNNTNPTTNEDYYDMHSHILPGLDHGASDMETAIAMIQKEAEEGIRHVVLTPHYFSGKNQKEVISSQYQKLCEEIRKREIPVTLYTGNEMMAKEQNLEDLQENLVSTIGDTSYLLTEFRTSDSFQYIHNILNQVQLSGYRPIVAHIERYEALKSKEAVSSLVQMGAIMQVNAGSFTKKHLQKYLISLAKEGLIHVVGSDSHDLTKRPPGIRCGTEILRKKIDREQYEKICFKNPERILKNDYI